MNIDLNKKYVVAVSFGPDSMSLLDMCIKQRVNIVVAHVNYHKRNESNFEQYSLTNFCKEKGINIEVLDTQGLQHSGNFQNWARNIRYDFFIDVLKKHNCDAILIAHQQDDLLETFLMQKNRNSYVKYWGIAEKSYFKNVEIIRPLLSYSKKELLDYCKDNSVPFSIDSSNLKDDYSRNKIRHSIVEKLSKKERIDLLKEIKSLQDKNRSREWPKKIKISKFNNLEEKEMLDFISSNIEKYNCHISLSKDFLKEIKKAFLSEKSFVEIKLSNNLFLIKEYGYVFVFKKIKIEYNLVLDEPCKYEDELFLLDFTNGLDDRNIKFDSFPISVKPVKKSESYIVKGYQCKVNRLFIDWKVPHHLREYWPGIYDKNDELIYLPRYRENFIDNHKIKFLIKFSSKF